MRLERTFARTDFSTDVIADAVRAFEAESSGPKNDPQNVLLAVDTPAGTWSFDSLDEFYAEHRLHPDRGSIAVIRAGSMELAVSHSEYSTTVTVRFPTKPPILRIMSVFDRVAEASRRPAPPPEPTPRPVIFIGHGRSTQWRDLKDHLQDLHGYTVEAYETGARGGHTIRDILNELRTKANFAILVMTAEDEAAGEMRARQNVVHETGLFQGTLGFARAIVLLEEGTKDYSNLQGVHQIRYTPGNIKETFGDVLATLRREFGAER
jgi:hypothetical protein